MNAKTKLSEKPGPGAGIESLSRIRHCPGWASRGNLLRIPRKHRTRTGTLTGNSNTPTIQFEDWKLWKRGHDNSRRARTTEEFDQEANSKPEYSHRESGHTEESLPGCG